MPARKPPQPKISAAFKAIAKKNVVTRRAFLGEESVTDEAAAKKKALAEGAQADDDAQPVQEARDEEVDEEVDSTSELAPEKRGRDEPADPQPRAVCLHLHNA